MDILNVWYKTGELAELSNLAERPFELRGCRFISVEHAYQSLKSGKFDPVCFGKYTRAGVKFIGKKGTKTEDDYNLRCMKYLMRLSFDSNPEAKELLLSTGDAILVHKQDRGIWKYVFPKFLMELREEFRAS